MIHTGDSPDQSSSQPRCQIHYRGWYHHRPSGRLILAPLACHRRDCPRCQHERRAGYRRMVERLWYVAEVVQVWRGHADRWAALHRRLRRTAPDRATLAYVGVRHPDGEMIVALVGAAPQRDAQTVTSAEAMTDLVAAIDALPAELPPGYRPLIHSDGWTGEIPESDWDRVGISTESSAGRAVRQLTAAGVSIRHRPDGSAYLRGDQVPHELRHLIPHLRGRDSDVQYRAQETEGYLMHDIGHFSGGAKLKLDKEQGDKMMTQSYEGAGTGTGGGAASGYRPMPLPGEEVAARPGRDRWRVVTTSDGPGRVHHRCQRRAVLIGVAARLPLISDRELSHRLATPTVRISTGLHLDRSEGYPIIGSGLREGYTTRLMRDLSDRGAAA